MMRFICFLVLFFTSVNSLAALTEYDRQEFATQNPLAPYNPGFESGKVLWTASPAMTISSSSQIVPNSKQYALWDSTSAGQTTCTPLVSLPKTGSCEGSLWVATPSGTATHLLTVNDGTNDIASQTIISSTSATKQTTGIFPCSAIATTAKLCLKSVASNEPSVSLDNARLGESTRTSSAQNITEWNTWTPTGSWSTNTTYAGKWRQVGTDAEFQVEVATSGAPTNASLTVNLPSGMVIDTSKIPGTILYQNFGIATFMDNGIASYTSRVSYSSTTSVVLYIANTGGTYSQSVLASATAPFTFGASDAVYATFKVPIVGFAPQASVMPAAQGWYIDANIGGSNFTLGGATVSSFTEMTDAGQDLVVNAGSAPAGIACSNGNASTVGTLTCPAGSESAGVTFNAPVTGSYEACFTLNYYYVLTAGSVLAAFQVDRTSSSSSTTLQEGRQRIVKSATVVSSSDQTGLEVCGVFPMNQGQNTVRLKFRLGVSGTVSNSVLTDRTDYGRDMHVTVKNVTAQTAALIANSVSTANANGDQIARATVSANCASTPCTMTSSSGVSSVTRSTTGQYVVNFSPAFSVAPTCTCTASQVGATFGFCSAPNGPATTTTFPFATLSSVIASSNNTITDSAFTVICVGPR
jgi:hypothetical protein